MQLYCTVLNCTVGCSNKLLNPIFEIKTSVELAEKNTILNDADCGT